VPNLRMKFPVGSNFCTLSLSESVTYMFPWLSTATPEEPLNGPSPLPRVLNLKRNLPEASNTCIRSLSESATYMFPVWPTAMPEGLLNCPSPMPELPHVDQYYERGDRQINESQGRCHVNRSERASAVTAVLGVEAVGDSIAILIFDSGGFPRIRVEYFEESVPIRVVCAVGKPVAPSASLPPCSDGRGSFRHIAGVSMLGPSHSRKPLS